MSLLFGESARFGASVVLVLFVLLLLFAERVDGSWFELTAVNVNPAFEEDE